MSAGYKSFIAIILLNVTLLSLIFPFRPNFSERRDYVAPPVEVKFLTMGFSAQAADSFWLRAVQDLDYCDKVESGSTCSQYSWLYQVINLVIELDRYFREAYYYGALSLSVILSDKNGSAAIFDKGVKQFANDWQLLYAAGYHALFEEKNYDKAYNLYLRASQNGAPNWVRLLAGNLAVDANQSDSAKKILEELINLESDPIWVEKLRKKITSRNR